jgi:hypothetical protein
MKQVIVILLFFMCCDTALAKKYLEPLGETASLRIVLKNPEAYSVFIAEYDPIACKKSADVGWVSGGRKIDSIRVGMPESEAPREGILERRIPSNRPFAFGTSFIIPKQSVAQSLMGAAFPGGASSTALLDALAAICEAPVFSAKPGEFYELHLQPIPQSCKSELFRLDTDPDGRLQRTSIETSRIRFPVSNKPSCSDLNP